MLQLEHVTYRVKDDQGEKTILNDVNLSLSERFVAFTGPNGGGKSTLAKVIAGILTPTEGRILWEGEDITSLSVTERAKKGISYAFQQPVRFKGLTVRDLISIAAGKSAKISDACAYLSEVGLCARDYIDRECFAVGRRAQTDRNRDDSRAGNKTFRIRRTRGGNRFMELRKSHQRI